RRFAAQDFKALRELGKRWSPTWDFADEEFAAMRECFADGRSLDAAFGYYRALSFLPPKHLKKPIAVPTVCFAGEDDPMMTPKGYERAARFFSNGYTIEAMPGGHFIHREHPQIFIDK